MSKLYDDELRDPTRDELYNGPNREKLPEAIQQMTADETACTFCGVSYFVFSEVQELQATVKKYKKTFHEFVRFMERERKKSHDIKEEVRTLTRHFNQLTTTFSTTVNQLTHDNKHLRHENSEFSMQLSISQREARNMQTEHTQSQIQFKRAEEEYKLASAMTEQRLRNEILHLSSLIEKCKLLTATQEANYAADLEKERVRIRELEALLESTRASLSSAERQLVTERDELKQQLLASKERVELEQEGAKQLEQQLRAVQIELSRVVSSNESERAGFAQLQRETTALKEQILHHEKAEFALTQEISSYKQELDTANMAMRSLRAQISTLENKIQENVIHIEQLKQNFAKDLETLRLDHGTMVNRLQRDHQKAVDELKHNQQTYIEHLKSQTDEKLQSETSTTQQALVQMENKLSASEKQGMRWKLQIEQQTIEMQQIRSAQESLKAVVDKLQQTVNTLEREKVQLQDENFTLAHQFDCEKAHGKHEVEKLKKEVMYQEQLLATQKNEFQQRVNVLQAQCDQLEQVNKGLKARATTNANGSHSPQHAWGENEDNVSSKASSGKRGSISNKPTTTPNNQDHDLEKLVDTLRNAIQQKDKEIVLLQQTVHRECIERTSLLEKMRSGKILPDNTPFDTSAAVRKSITPNHNEEDGREEEDGDDPSTGNDNTQPKASFYERLRRAGHRKSKTIRK